MTERFLLTGATGTTAAIVASQHRNKGAAVRAPVFAPAMSRGAR